MKINSNSNYIIFGNKLQQFMLKDAEDFIQEIHYHTSQNEIIGIITYLKQNINEIAKQKFNTNHNVSEIGIPNSITLKYIKDELLENHYNIQVSRIQNTIDQMKYLLKQYLKNNDLINVSRMNEEIQNIQLPSKLHIILNVPHITLEYDLIPTETNPNTYVRKFA